MRLHIFDGGSTDLPLRKAVVPAMRDDPDQWRTLRRVPEFYE